MIKASVHTVLIVYHSRTGGTRQMAQAAAIGAQSESSVQVSLMRASEATSAQLVDASAYIFACPENLASMSGEMKEFFDRTYYTVLDQLNGRPYGVLVCAGSDGRNAARQIERIATGWRLKSIAAPLIVCTESQTADAISKPRQIAGAKLKECEELGATLAAGIALGVF